MMNARPHMALQLISVELATCPITLIKTRPHKPMLAEWTSEIISLFILSILYQPQRLGEARRDPLSHEDDPVVWHLACYICHTTMAVPERDPDVPGLRPFKIDFER